MTYHHSPAYHLFNINYLCRCDTFMWMVASVEAAYCIGWPELLTWYMANESQSTYLCAKSNDIRHHYTVVGISRTLFRGPSNPGLSISCNTDHFFHVRYFFSDSNCNKIKDRGLLCSKIFLYDTFFFSWVSTILQVTFFWPRSVFYHLW